MAEREKGRIPEPSIFDRIRVHTRDIAEAENEEDRGVFLKKVNEELDELAERIRPRQDREEKETP